MDELTLLTKILNKLESIETGMKELQTRLEKVESVAHPQGIMVDTELSQALREFLILRGATLPPNSPNPALLPDDPNVVKGTTTNPDFEPLTLNISPIWRHPVFDPHGSKLIC